MATMPLITCRLNNSGTLRLEQIQALAQGIWGFVEHLSLQIFRARQPSLVH